ncbi:unnamed protein product [Adineta steineri]|uniref:Uncharacterized protein n=1 Tax=Adineta steineri TaxID=433720 RepID=A0A813WCV9_9BILA|nr:unnamed protein product [Adineta steineri]CAF1199042.1 unnamed protein product [Adineta steineri]
METYSCGCEVDIQSRDSNVGLQFQYLSEQQKSMSNLETLIIENIPNEYDTSTITKLSFRLGASKGVN